MDYWNDKDSPSEWSIWWFTLNDYWIMHLLLERINDNILVLHFVSQNVWFTICDTLLALCHIIDKRHNFCATLLVIVDHCDKTKNKDFVLHCCPWFDLKWVGYVSKLWSKCLPFRACLWAFLSAFYWRFCLVGLSVYSYPGLEAHVCDGLSGWKKYVTCVKTLLLSSSSCIFCVILNCYNSNVTCL